MSLEKVDPNTLYITHIFEGEEVVAGGEDGQAYVASFASHAAAGQYVEQMQRLGFSIMGERGPIRKLEGV